MLRCAVLAIVIFIVTFGFAQVKQTSYYYVAGTDSMTDYSKQKFENFLLLLEDWEIQVIEVNSFAQMNGKSSKVHDSISKVYEDFFLKQIPDQLTEPTVTTYGAQRPGLTFTPLNWNRIDVYYFKGEQRTKTAPRYFNDTLSNKPRIADSTLAYDIKEIPVVPNLALGTPVVTPIKFIGGKAKVRADSFGYMNYLYETLKTNTGVSAHIRGHVCCGPNLRISKKRAKTVYKYLIKRGIEKSRLSYKGYSNTTPMIVPERTSEDRAANRRVDIIFSEIETTQK